MIFGLCFDFLKYKEKVKVLLNIKLLVYLGLNWVLIMYV